MSARDTTVPTARCCLLLDDSGLSTIIYIAYFGVAA